MLRSLPIALLALAVLPVTASAAVVEFSVKPKAGADFGTPHTFTGKLTGPYGAPLVGRQVVLEARRYPFRSPYRPVASATSGEDGRFAFEHALDRNHRVRILVVESGERSVSKRAFVFPAASLSFTVARRNVIRIVQKYRTPKNVKLTKPTLFYVGKAGKPTAPLAARAKTKRVKRKGKVRKGRFRAAALVRIPRAWKGEFRYASCFPYNAGMGNPKLGCPKKRYRF